MNHLQVSVPVCGSAFILMSSLFVSCTSDPTSDMNGSTPCSFRYGAPHAHISDQGREFVNSVMKALECMTGIRHRITSAYHPQANGLVENMNRKTIEGLLTTIENQDDWPKALPEVQAKHNATRHYSTKFTPFKLCFGVPMRLPNDLLVRTMEMRGDNTLINEPHERCIEPCNF